MYAKHVGHVEEEEGERTQYIIEGEGVCWGIHSITEVNEDHLTFLMNEERH